MTPATARITLLAFFAMVVLLSLPGCNDGCGFGSGSCIGIGEPQPEPEPTCEVSDECVGEVILDLCPPVEEPEACPPPRVEVIVVYADPDTEECDLTIPVGHRPIECRGKDHAR